MTNMGMRVRFWRLGATLAIAAMLGACVTARTGTVATLGDGSEMPLERPGTRIKVRNPLPEKWAISRVQSTKQDQTSSGRVWICRPLACAAQAAVSIQLRKSPTRNPDRKALEKIAKLLPTQAKAQDLMMEAVSDGDERIAAISTKVTEVRGYPAILGELKKTSRGKISYLLRGDIFVGDALVKVTALSSERADNQKHFDSFMEAMEIQVVDPVVASEPALATIPVSLDGIAGAGPAQ
jgi:hypothetical protein